MKIYKDRNNEEIEKIPEIKKYFSKIFTVLSKEMRDKLMELNLPKEKLKKIKKELAFLSKEKQERYINELLDHFN
ncbi:MAG: hypothetical protein ACFFE4_14030 [Candidatus Thorarchaeota archaeon]